MVPVLKPRLQGRNLTSKVQVAPGVKIAPEQLSFSMKKSLELAQVVPTLLEPCNVPIVISDPCRFVTVTVWGGFEVRNS